MKNLVILLPLILVVFLAGCINQPKPVSTGTGVIIKSFGSDVPEIYSGDSVIFNLVVENVGGEDATNVKATLGNLPLDWTISPQKTLTVGGGELSKSLPEQQIPGGTGDAQWDVKSSEGLNTADYKATVRVTYTYTTTATGTIKVYNNNYLKTLKIDEAEKLRKSNGIETFQSIPSPLLIGLTGAARPFILTKDGQTHTVSFQISNIGSGYPYTTTPGDLTVTIKNLKIYNTICVPSGTTVKVPRTGSKAVSCTVTLPNLADVEMSTTIPVEATIQYNYYVDGEAIVHVLKAPE